MTPDQYTISERMVTVGDGHELYAHYWGSKAAKETIVFLHGGPGTGCRDKQKGFFDPRRQRVLFFDQRGSGKSTPYGSLAANDTAHLVEDINKLTKIFGIKNFTFTGGSWGSCLALAYAIKYPKRVNAMVLRGVFSGRKEEIDFLNNGEFKAFFPEAWAAFQATVPKRYRKDPSGYHLRTIFGNDPEASKQSAYAFSCFEGSVISIDDRQKEVDFDTFDPVQITIEAHYLIHNCFLPEGYVMRHASRLTMPVWLIQGRYDAVCPPYTAYELAERLPNVRLLWTSGGHVASDRGNWETIRGVLSTIG